MGETNYGSMFEGEDYDYSYLDDATFVIPGSGKKKNKGEAGAPKRVEKAYNEGPPPKSEEARAEQAERDRSILRINEDRDKTAAANKNAVDEAERRAREEHQSRNEMVFGMQFEEIEGGRGDLKIKITVPPGETPIKKHVAKAPRDIEHPTEPIDAPLSEYLPDLKKIHVRYGTEPGLHFDEKGEDKDGQPILYVPNNLDDDARRALVPAIILAVTKRSMRFEKDLKKNAEIKLDNTTKTLHDTSKKLEGEHSSDHRVHKYEHAEEAWVLAEEERMHVLEKKLHAVLDRVKEEQHLDLAAPVGGTEKWLQDLAVPVHQRIHRKWLASPSVIFGDHEHAPNMKGTKGYLNRNVLVPMMVDIKMINGKFEQIREEVKALPNDTWTNKWRKSLPMAGLRNTAHGVRWAWQLPKHTVGTAVMYTGSIGIGLFKWMWGATELPILKGIKEQLKEWGNWGLEFTPIKARFPVDKGGKKDDHH